MTNLYTLNKHFGSEDDFKELVSACHKKDIWVMVDVVANHVGPVGFDFSRITPFNSADHYHDNCDITDWGNQWQVENCRLCELPDLKQENNWVTEKLVEWIHDLVEKYDIDGIRIDTIMEVPKWFWDKFRSSAGVFQIGEAFNGDINYVSDYQRHLDSVFNYPLYYSIESGFCGNFRNIEGYWMNNRGKYPAPEYTATFVENHDNPRFLNRCNDRNKFTNAVVFALLWEGIPVFYYGGEQYFSGGADPNNREPLWGNYNTGTDLYKILGKIHELRKKVSIWDLSIVQRYADNNFYAFTRGNVLACFTNASGVRRTITYHDFKDGDKLCDILSNDCVSVSGGKIDIEMGNYPKVYVKQ
jgi:alpha-amylase